MVDLFNGHLLMMGTTSAQYNMRQPGLKKFGSVADLQAWLERVRSANTQNGIGEIVPVSGVVDSATRKKIKAKSQFNRLFVAEQFYPPETEWKAIKKLQNELRAEQCALMVGFYAPDDSLTAEFANSQSPQVTW